jgi:hypothetical protein
MAEKKNGNKKLAVKPEGHRHVRPRRRWKDNITTDHKATEWEAADCVHEAQDRDHWQPFVNTVIKLHVP